MTFTKTTQIVLAIALQLVATSAFSQTTFDITTLDGLTDLQFDSTLDYVDVDVDGNGTAVSVSYDNGRPTTDEYLARSVWAVFVLHPQYHELLIVTMDPAHDDEVIDLFHEAFVPELDGYLAGVLNHPDNPHAVFMKAMVPTSSDSDVDEATANHILVFLNSEPMLPKQYFEWNEHSEIVASYSIDAGQFSVNGSFPITFAPKP